MADVVPIPDLPENGLQNEEFNSLILEPIRQSLANLEATNTAQTAALAAIPTVYKDSTLPLTAKLRDLWIDPSSNYQARICTHAYASGAGVVGDWEDLHDSEAYAKAGDAELVAGSASQTWLLNDPPDHAREGDLWVELDNNKQVWVCLETYTIAELDPASKWEKTQDEGAVLLAVTVEGLVDGQVETFYDTDVPEAADARDIWVKEQEIDGEAVFTALMATSSYLATDGPGDYPSMAAFRESKWVLTSDPTALAAAEAAHGLADGKTYTHYLNDWPEAADARDIFHNMLTNKTYVCIDDYTSAYTGTMDGVKWERIQDPVAQARADAAWSLADGKVVTYIQATMPDAADLKDLWFDSDDNYKLYVCILAYTTGAGTDAKWSAQTDNSKAVVYSQDTMPSAAVERDLWIDTANDRKQYVCIQTYTTGGQLGVNWLSTNDNKKVTYVQQAPPDTADFGDGWLDTVTGTGQNQFYVCNTAYTGGAHNWSGLESPGKWTPSKDKVTEDLANDAAIAANTAQLRADAAYAIADGKIDTFIQATMPTAADIKDMWLDSDDAYRIYVCNTTYTTGNGNMDKWTVQAGNQSPDTFSQDEMPAAAEERDLWIDTDNNNKMYVCAQTYTTGGTIGVHWLSTSDDKKTNYIDGNPPLAADVGDGWLDTETPEGQYLFYVCNTPYTGNAHGWVSPTDSGKWTPARDPLLVASIEAAQSTANGKTTTYYRQTIPTAAGFGDTWVDTDDNLIYVCKIPYTTGGTVETNWDITSDPVAQASADLAKSLADSKRRTFYSNEVPDATAQYAALGYGIDIGDLWCDTNNDFQMYICKQAYTGVGSSTYWQETQDPVARAAAIAAQSAVDQKRTTFYTAGDSTYSTKWPGLGIWGNQIPISFWEAVGGAALGDMWFHTNTTTATRYTYYCITAYTGYEADPGSLASWASLTVDSTVQAALDLKVDKSTYAAEKGAVNGIATLDSTGRLPASQLTVSAMEYKGVWNANTNMPTLADGGATHSVGDIYRVSVGATRNLGSGSIEFAAGDWALYSDSLVWEKGDNTDFVTSVAGRTGAITLASTDISGLGTAAAAASTDFTPAAHAGSALVGAHSGVGDAAGKNVGTVAGTVAAGDDLRLGTSFPSGYLAGDFPGKNPLGA